ncbi:MAG: N-6 DNA methylase [Oscillospiraceae bacterium]|nr:N-6 DNA methylase [Oscillospiraceae bacterium]
MNNQEIVAKLWRLCDVLRDDGITYQQYVTELTYILFLKMCKETNTENAIPEEYRWDKLVEKAKIGGIDLKNFYKNLLEKLGNMQGRIHEIYQGAQTSITEPKNLEKIIRSINDIDWFEENDNDNKRGEKLGAMYEGLLEKNATEKKSGAGQYFTPRVLINIMTMLIAPQAGERCNDPACGTFGFMIAADQYVKRNTDNLYELNIDEQEFQRTQAFSGCELVHDTHRLALMNAMLHDIDGTIYLGDTLSNYGKQMNGYDVVLTNPPFGTKKGGERATRDDFTFPTSNKQLNFLQHIYRSLNQSGHARAAVVLPDNVLFADGDGEKIRRDLMEKCNLHTILRLPTGIFYAQGVKTNVLFFTRGTTDKGNTKEVWIYDLRSEMPSFGKTNPLKESHFDDFVKCYHAENISERQETYSIENPNGRWRRFTYEEILERDKTSLDISWIKSQNTSDDYTLSELLEIIKTKSENIASAVVQLESLIGEVDE